MLNEKSYKKFWKLTFSARYIMCQGLSTRRKLHYNLNRILNLNVKHYSLKLPSLPICIYVKKHVMHFYLWSLNNACTCCVSIFRNFHTKRKVVKYFNRSLKSPTFFFVSVMHFICDIITLIFNRQKVNI